VHALTRFIIERRSVVASLVLAVALTSMSGHGSLAQDFNKGFKAYANGDFAQFLLGVRYHNGEGVIQDAVYAHMWMNIAASLGNKMGKTGRDIFAKDMTAADISKAQELARECVRKNYKGC
jgi:TPR repeat protein